MEIRKFFLYLLVMAGVTYLVRVVPYVLMKGEVKNRFFKSFLAYIPYTVLAAMTFPTLLSAPGNIYSAAAGLVVGVILAYFERGLLMVATGSCLAVLIADILIQFVFK